MEVSLVDLVDGINESGAGILGIRPVVTLKAETKVKSSKATHITPSTAWKLGF